MKFNPIKCWKISSRIIDQEVETQRPEDFTLLKKSILKRGYRGYVVNDRAFIEDQEWYQDFLLGNEVLVYIDGSGVYKVANIDLSENEVYFERTDIPVGYRPWIFFSWQSDWPEVRTEMEEVLQEIIVYLNENRSPRLPLELKNSSEIVGGAPNIVTNLKKEIDRSLVFIADLTNVANVISPEAKAKPKWHPNSNVVFEMAYALTRKLKEQVILVKKDRPEKSENITPFDVYQNRTHFYSDREELKTSLLAAVTSSLEMIGYIGKLN